MLVIGRPVQYRGPGQHPRPALAPGRQLVIAELVLGLVEVQQVEPGLGLSTAVRGVGQVGIAMAVASDLGSVDQADVGVEDRREVVTSSAGDPYPGILAAAVRQSLPGLLGEPGPAAAVESLGR